MIIYRLEHPENKKGPWRVASLFGFKEECADAWKNIIYRTSDSAHPGWHEEFTMREADDIYREDCVTGVRSLSMVHHWFGNDWIVLYEHGQIVLSAYEVEDNELHVGAYQVAFQRANARHLHNVSPQQYKDALRKGE